MGNLPKKNKKVKPSYQHIRKQDIPIIDQGEGTTIKVLVGNINDISSIIHTYSPVSIFDIQVSQPNEINLTVSKNQIAMIYVIDGELKFAKENKKAINGQMIYFDQSSNEVQLTSISSSGSYLMLAGKPLEETIVSYGPFITNTESEMNQSILDYKNGEMGHKI